jgi:hypothetical protein
VAANPNFYLQLGYKIQEADSKKKQSIKEARRMQQFAFWLLIS